MSRRFRLSNALTALVLVLALAPAAAEDLTIVSKVTAAKANTTSTLYIGEHRIRTSDGRFDTILDYQNGSMIHIDHKKKRYSETNLEEMRAHFVELEKVLEDNPMLAKMLGKAGQVRVERTGEKREIAGYGCERYILTIGEAMTFDQWVTHEIEIPISYYDARKMAYAMMGPMAARFEKMLDAMKEIGGVPLTTTVNTKMMGIDAGSTSEAIEIRRGPLPADAFDLPAGYKKQKSAYN